MNNIALLIGIFVLLALAISLFLVIRKAAVDKKHLANLALFPEQNPNPVIEVRLNGEVSYMNPAAIKLFPELRINGFEHHLLSEISAKLGTFRNGTLKTHACELTVNERIYEQKIYAIPESNILRVYSSDITQQKENEKRLANLALFPEQNPNPVIELKLDGKVSYLNPAARNRFPDMQDKGSQHKLFDVIRPHFISFQNGELSSYLCEIHFGEEIYEQKVYSIPESKILRVYSSDITERKHTEKLIRQKNEDITDSINYAKRIQRSMLPKDDELEQALKDHFVLYLPKDIVSGDFYWATKLRTTPESSNGNELSVVAAVDCTGHGVPGALMSIIGNTLLNQTIRNPNINSPAEALDFLNQELPKNLRANKGEVIRDGMDMTMCAIDYTKRTVHFAGANNPIYIVSKGSITELKADKQPISGSTDEVKKPFTNQTLQLEKGDHIYLFTDGYADQFGGPHGKKFKYKPFQELLLQNVNLEMHEQKAKLERAFAEWRGNLEQVDDVLVIGIRL